MRIVWDREEGERGPSPHILGSGERRSVLFTTSGQRVTKNIALQNERGGKKRGGEDSRERGEAGSSSIT